MTQFSCKGHSDVARVGYLDWTLTKCQSREAISIVPRWGQRISGVNLPETDRGNVPCNVASFTMEQIGQILAGVTHLACSESLCTHEKHPLLCAQSAMVDVLPCPVQ